MKRFVLLLAATAAWGHHSTAPFDMQNFSEVHGKVIQFRWMNPHSYIDLKVGEQTWLLEAESLNLLRRNGWTKDTLKPGDEITCTGGRAKDPKVHAMKCFTITFPDGRTMKATPLSVPSKNLTLK